MNRNHEISDQFNNWSDNEETKCDKFAPPSRESPSSASIHEAGSFAGLVDRALQEVWQAGLQVRARSGSWSEVLSVGEHSRRSSGDDLRAAGLRRSGEGLSCEPCGSSRAVGGNLRNQSRAHETSRAILVNRYGLSIGRGFWGRRLFGRRDVGRKHDSRLPSWRTGRGGERR